MGSEAIAGIIFGQFVVIVILAFELYRKPAPPVALPPPLLPTAKPHSRLKLCACAKFL